MKIKIEVDEKLNDTQVVIKCNSIDDEVIRLESLLSDAIDLKPNIVFYKNDQEYYISISDILFFETDNHGVTAHTVSNMYYVKLKLYELENVLPNTFVRVSKSTIINSKKVYSILKNITSASRVEFYDTHKKIYVSRKYYNTLKSKLMEKRR